MRRFLALLSVGLPAVVLAFFSSLCNLGVSPPLFAQNQPRASCQTTPAPAEQCAFGEKLQVRGIPNAGKISEVLFRGAQPHASGLPELKKLGITTIVDLRGEDANKIEWERRHAEALGIHFVHIPISGWKPPTDEQVAQFLALFRDDPPQRIFVHCRFGDDRTGVFVATYRMALQKWPSERSEKEMYYFGFNGLWHPAMKSYIRDFPARLDSAPALATFRPAPAAPNF
jgi:tyrosine-protein phosphatase SIW14